MKIKLLKFWNGCPPGKIVEPQMNEVALNLIRRGHGVLVTETEEPKQDKRKPKLQEWVKQSDVPKAD